MDLKLAAKIPYRKARSRWYNDYVKYAYMNDKNRP